MVVYPWQRFIISAIYGFKYKLDKSRVVRTAVISMAKKNGKSTFTSIPVIYDLFSRQGANIVLAALDKNQTRNVFDPIELMINNNADLKQYVETSKKQKTIIYPERYGVITTLSKGAENKQGIKPTLAIVDEYYLYKDDALLSIIKYGFRSVSNPLLIMITTNGKNKNTPYYQEYERCNKILEGIIEDNSTFCIFYEYDESDKYEDYTKLIKANPMVGYTLSYDKDFKNDLLEVKQKPYRSNDYKMLTCNLWVDGIVNNWIPDKIWKHSIRKEPDIKGLPCSIGLDLSKVNDFSAVTKYFLVDGVYVARHKFFIPENQIEEKMKTDSILIKDWIEKGFIIATPGDVIDYDYILKEIKDTEIILGIGYDPYNSKYIIENLPEKLLIPLGQSLRDLCPLTKEWEKAIYDKKIIDNNPVMRWMLSCATIRPDANGNYKPLKPDQMKSSKRIDGVITSIMAMAIHAMTKPQKTYTADEIIGFI